MDDIIQSLNRAMVKQGWNHGDRFFRIGHPFEWIDGDNQPNLYSVRGVMAFRQYLSMYYEQYPTPEEIITDDYEEIKAHNEEILWQATRHFLPFLQKDSAIENNVVSTALARLQDYCFIKTYCKDLVGSQVNHLDIGPGLGSHAIYSLKGFQSTYYGVEASPHSYNIQRQFLRFLSFHTGEYLDLVECENFQLDSEQTIEALNQKSNYRIKHVPSWMYPLVKEKMIDLITATWVLNEVSYSAIIWLISHATRVLRQGGYIYIRDSSKLKPLRHAINYDELLLKMGFVEVGRLKVRNRIDYYGIPRAYQKITDAVYSFEELTEAYLGKFAFVAQGGDYVQNTEQMPKSIR